MDKEAIINAHFSPTNGFGVYKPQAVSLLKATIDYLNANAIQNCLIAGTLLGKVRHNDLIPWDDDMDLLVDAHVLHVLNVEPSSPIRFVRQNDYIVKSCFNTTDKGYTWPFIDLFIYRWPNPQTINFFKRDWPAAEFFPLVKTQFLGFEVSIPRNARYFLAQNYGEDYMRTIKTTGWNHREERQTTKNATIKLVYDMPWHF